MFGDSPKHKCNSKCISTDKHYESRRVLIEGAPGSGKSTLCRKLAYDWANTDCEKYWIHRFEVAFLIEVRHLLGNVIDGILQQLLPLDIPDTIKEEFIMYLKNPKHQHKILFLVSWLMVMMNWELVFIQISLSSSTKSHLYLPLSS